jgi:hypothetical protein
MDREAAETLALETFRSHKGKVLLVRFLDGYRGNDSCTQEFNPPIRVKVVETNRFDIIHWNDDYLDPYWDVAVLDHRQELNGLRSTWVNGPSINIPTGQVEQSGKDWIVGENKGGFSQRLCECFGQFVRLLFTHPLTNRKGGR